ncbi:MAG: hypothetical protein DGJ47_001146 [Rickettsiaceae bacterium]
MPFDIDIAIVAAFLIINLGVGLYYGRDVKTIEDYATGNRNFSTAALVSTIVATAMTGSLFAAGISRTYTDGLYDFIPTCGVPMSLFLLAYFIIPKMKSFMKNISIAEAMGKRYGKTVRIITAMAAIIASSGLISMQYKVFGSIVSYFLNIDIVYAVITTGLIVTLYSAFGGIRSVTFTDIIQFMIFGTIIPLIGIILWKTTVYSEGFSYQQTLVHDNFNLKRIVDTENIKFWSMMALFTYFAIPSANPAFFQRIVMGQNIKQVKRAFFISSVIILLMIIAVSWIGFLLFSLEPELDSTKLIPYIIDNYSYNGFKGLFIAGLMAMIMSSADSFTNAASVLFVHDILKPLDLVDKKELIITRLFACILGIIAIIMALSKKDLLEILLFANAFFKPLVTSPLLITILGFRTTSKAILSGMAGGFITVIVLKFSSLSFDPIIPGILVNLIVMKTVHYIGRQKGGWIEVAMEKDDEKPSMGILQSIYTSIRYFNFTEFVYKNSPRSESTYSFFGIFCFISTITTIYLTQMEMIGKHGDLVTYLHMIMLVISTFFGLHMMWSDRVRNPILVSTVWHFALIYNMTFCTSFFLFLSNFNNVQVIVFTLNMTALFHVCRWKTAITAILIGISGSIITYKNMVGDILTGGNIDNYNVLMYVALMSAAALFAFSKPKQEYVEETEEKVGELERKVGSLTIESNEKDKKNSIF